MVYHFQNHQSESDHAYTLEGKKINPVDIIDKIRKGREKLCETKQEHGEIFGV